VEGVGDESEGVAPEPVEQLDEGERQVDAQEPEKVPGVAVRYYKTKPAIKVKQAETNTPS
jgi:hypothetical protein